MSIWAQDWAYAQKLGTTDEKGNYKGQPGKKFTLVCLAGFADAKGYCWPGQDTLGDMSDQASRSVRRHLKELEEEDLLIEREKRGKAGGGRTSDGYWLLAPPEALVPKGTSPDPLARGVHPDRKSKAAKSAGMVEEADGDPGGGKPANLDNQTGQVGHIKPVNLTGEPSEGTIKEPSVKDPTPPAASASSGPKQVSKKKSSKKKKGKIKGGEVDYDALIADTLREDRQHLHIRQLIDLAAQENKSQEISSRRAYTEFVGGLIELRENGFSERIIRYGLSEAIRMGRGSIRYAKACMVNKVAAEQKEGGSTEHDRTQPTASSAAGGNAAGGIEDDFEWFFDE